MANELTYIQSQSLKPRPNALYFSLYNARHSCIVKCRERLAIFSSEVELILLCRVKFDQSQNVERCRVLSRALGHPTRLSRAHAGAVAAVFYIIGKSFIVNNIEAPKAPLYHWFLLSFSNIDAPFTLPRFCTKTDKKMSVFVKPFTLLRTKIHKNGGF